MRNPRYMFLVAALLVGGMFPAWPSATVSAAEDVDVECYVLKDGDYEYVDNIDSFDAAKGAAACNTEYIDCGGRCIGCFLDDEDNEVCYDKTGEQVDR